MASFTEASTCPVAGDFAHTVTGTSSGSTGLTPALRPAMIRPRSCLSTFAVTLAPLHRVLAAAVAAGHKRVVRKRVPVERWYFRITLRHARIAC